jgi:hypothetical protein
MASTAMPVCPGFSTYRCAPHRAKGVKKPFNRGSPPMALLSRVAKGGKPRQTGDTTDTRGQDAQGGTRNATNPCPNMEMHDNAG